MIRLRYKILGVLLALATILGLVRYCGRAKPVQGGTLAPGERKHVTVKGHSVIITDRNGATKQYAPDRVDISLSDTCGIKVKVKEMGFGLEPGVIGLYNGRTAKFGFDTRLAYYYRASLHVGFDLNLSDDRFYDIVKPITFVNYSLPILDSQLGVFVGYEFNPQMMIGGIRWRL